MHVKGNLFILFFPARDFLAKCMNKDRPHMANLRAKIVQMHTHAFDKHRLLSTTKHETLCWQTSKTRKSSVSCIFRTEGVTYRLVQV